MQRRTFLAFASLLPGLAILRNPAQAQAPDPAFVRVTTPREFESVVRRARERRKPILVYVSAEWCPICKSIERRVFAHPVIKMRLASIALVRADVTELYDGSRALMERFRVAGPPTMFAIDPKNGRELPRTRLVGAVDANLFLDTLNIAGL
ncbi:thioredoxin family protein [Microvirga massiliensis]|uniref:thioredoxin family protein n=1 Tax=Microvirga massiliensis TaxID=1033741 RepID=UPI00062BD330|nr:thioredoxin family protein [Microvirga massiliensis]